MDFVTTKLSLVSFPLGSSSWVLESWLCVLLFGQSASTLGEKVMCPGFCSDYFHLSPCMSYKLLCYFFLSDWDHNRYLDASLRPEPCCLVDCVLSTPIQFTSQFAFDFAGYVLLAASFSRLIYSCRRNPLTSYAGRSRGAWGLSQAA